MDAEPNYKGRLIFAEMGKPKPDDRPEDWIAELKAEINNSLQNQSSIELLWAWNDLVKESCAKIGQDMTSVAQAATVGTHRELNDGLKATMQHLAAAQSAGDFSTDTAPRHLLTVLTQLLMDQLEHPTGIAGISAGGVWLSETPPGAVADSFPGKMNGLLLTSDNSVDGAIYAPGTVFKIADPTKFSAAFGKEIPDLMAMWIKQTAAKWTDWQRDARPILIELSPICDLAQGYRVNSLLVAGVIAPIAYAEAARKSGDAFGAIAKFHLRWPVDGLPEQDVLLAYCHRYKTTLPAGHLAGWLQPWFRLRELPAAAIRNANAAHAARIGYVSLA